jgi:hypothetical protein
MGCTGTVLVSDIPPVPPPSTQPPSADEQQPPTETPEPTPDPTPQDPIDELRLPPECTSDPQVCPWPNSVSKATSDRWISFHHDRITVMRPKILVVNFANGIGYGGNDNLDGGPLALGQIQSRAQEFVRMLREASRFHGYSNPESRPFLEPEIVKIVNLQDASRHANSEYFPRGPSDPSGSGYRLVGYHKLFTEEYAPHWGFEENGRYLTLGELLHRGLVHEVVMMANQVDGRDPNPPDQVTAHILEIAYVAQVYDDQLQPIVGEYVRNGGSEVYQRDDMTNPTWENHNSMLWTGRSSRIYFLNVLNGPGDLMHALIHEFEHRYNEARVWNPESPHHLKPPNPYMQPLFRTFAGFDMRSRFGVSFDSLYAGGDSYTYSDCTRGVCTSLGYGVGQSIASYHAGCGNAHYPPGAARGYDYAPTAGVMSYCEDFLVPGAPLKPANRRWLNDPTYASFEGAGAKFYLYWFQNHPGRGNQAIDAAGNPIKNWWPFMYY